MIKNEAILASIYMIEDYKNGVHFLDKTVERIISGLRLLDKELEALQQTKSCAKCKSFKLDDEHNDGFGQCFWGIHFPNGNSSSYHKGTDFYCSEFEAKEQ